MEETREDRQKRIAQNASRIQIRSLLENLHNLPKMFPAIPVQAVEKIQSALKDFLPIIKDQVKDAIANQSEKMGAGADRKSYVFRNGEDGLEVWVLKNAKFAGEKVSVFSFKKITDRIDKYTKAESFIADAITGRLFSEEDYVIDEANTGEQNEEAQKKLMEDKQKQLEAPKE